MTYSHVLTNAGNSVDTFTIDCVSGEGWDVEPGASIRFDPWQSTTFVVSVTVVRGHQ